MSAARDVGTNYLEFFGKLDSKGQEFAANSRNRMRASYIAAKNYGKFQDWTESNNDAFAIIDHMVIGLTRDAGFSEVQKAPTYTLQNAPADMLEAEAARRGLRVVLANAPPQLPGVVMPASSAQQMRPLAPVAPPMPAAVDPVAVNPFAPRDLDEGGSVAVDVEDSISKLVTEHRKPKG